MKFTGSAFAVAVWTVLLVPARPQTLVRMTAGEARSLPDLPVPLTAIRSARIDPPMRHPFLFELDGAGMRVIVPPATPPGVYRVAVEGDGSTADFTVSVEAIEVPRSAAARVPVVLLNGFQFICTNRASTLVASKDTFGLLGFQLQSDGAPVVFFNNCAYGNDVPLEELATQLAAFLGNITYSDGSPVEQVDLVAHSMGGLIARAYLAGLRRDGSLFPPADPKVRKLILAATPNFGSFQAGLVATNQTGAMFPASAFLRSLAEWNQHQDDLRGVDALALIGVAGIHYQGRGGMDDGVVATSSAALGFARPDERTRLVPYCHVTPDLITVLGMDCTAARGIVDVDGDAHFSARIIRSFLADTEDWRGLGSPPSRDATLATSGGVYVDAETAGGLWVSDLTQMSFGTVPLSPGGIAGTTFYKDFVTGSASFTGSRKNLGSLTCGPFTMSAGTYRGVFCKELPSMASVTPLLSPALSSPNQARVVPSGGSIVINGAGFGQPCSTCTVTLNPGGVVLPVSSWTPSAITVTLPALSGLVQLVLQATTGRDSINIMAAAPASPVQVASLGNAASGTGIAIAPGEIVAIKGTGMGPAKGVSFSVNQAGSLDTSLAGVRVMFGGVPAPVLYASAVQINAIVPYEIAGQTQVTVQVSYAGSASAGVPVAVASAAPAVFTASSTGVGQALVANQDGTLNTPFTPAAAGSFITLYFTGGGQTSPPGVTGSVNGSTLKRASQNVLATVGGVPAVVTFAGAAPGLVDGVMQLNLQLSPFTPPGGAQPLVLTMRDVSSASNVTLAVQ